jgi:hypothetical protein
MHECLSKGIVSSVSAKRATVFRSLPAWSLNQSKVPLISWMKVIKTKCILNITFHIRDFGGLVLLSSWGSLQCTTKRFHNTDCSIQFTLGTKIYPFLDKSWEKSYSNGLCNKVTILRGPLKTFLIVQSMVYPTIPILADTKLATYSL